MDQKDYRKMIIETIFKPLLLNMVVEGMIEEFQLSEDPDDLQSTVIKLKTDRPEELEDVTLEEVEEARQDTIAQQD